MSDRVQQLAFVRVLDALLEHGTCSYLQLCEHTGLADATVEKVVRMLDDWAMVHCCEQRDRGIAGRPLKLIAIHPRFCKVGHEITALPDTPAVQPVSAAGRG